MVFNVLLTTGVNADCNLRGLTPVCSCPKTHTGNPFVSCRPFTPGNQSINNNNNNSSIDISNIQIFELDTKD